MYISGNLSNFAQRVHQLSVSGLDIRQFETEGYNYTGVWASGGRGVTEKRVFQSAASSVTKTGYYYNQLFTGIRYF